MIDKAIRDCQSVTNRHPPTSADEDNHAYNGFRLGQLDPRDIVRVKLPSGAIQYRVPSKFACVGSAISVYSQKNKSDVPGEAHTGHSVDTRFGVMNKGQADAIQEQIPKGTRRDRELAVGERDEEARRGNERSFSFPQHKGQHGSFRGNRQTRRSRRGPRDGPPTEQFQQRESSNSGEAGSMCVTHQSLQTNVSKSFQISNNQNSQVRPQEQQLEQCRPQHTIVPPETLREMGKFDESRYGEQFLLLAPYLPSMGHVDYTGVRRADEPQHLAAQAMANAREAGLPGHYLKFIPKGYRSNSNDPTRNELLEEFYSQGLDRFWESEDEYVTVFYRDLHNQRRLQPTPNLGSQEDAQGRVTSDNQPNASQGDEEGMQSLVALFNRHNASHDLREVQGRAVKYTTPHRATAQRGNREYAQFLDEMNREQPLGDGHLRGDVFVGHPTLQPRVEVEPPSPSRNVLAAIAVHRDRLNRTQNQQSIGSRLTSTELSSKQSTLVNYSASNAALNRSTASSEAGVGSDDNVQRGRPSGSARARAADERRAASGAQHASQYRPLVQIDTAVLAPSGIFSREPSPMPPRSSRLFDQSRRSSPGATLHNQKRGHRSSSAGFFH